MPIRNIEIYQYIIVSTSLINIITDTKMQKPYLSLIIPAYNEESRIEASLEKALEYLNKQSYSWELLVIDDGSKDNTVNLVKKFPKPVDCLIQPNNLGKGAAVRRGMLDSSGQYRIFTDADFSTPIYEVTKILKNLEIGFDICIGSRAIDKSLVKEHQPFYREFMGKTFNKIVQTLLFKGIKDTQCGFKGFSEKAVQTIFPKAKINGFSFDVEILYLAQEAGLKVAQEPVEWYNDNRSKVNPIFDSTRMFVELFKIRNLHK
jgi:dolichyl-phosphate beta-glucosyltransferase